MPRDSNGVASTDPVYLAVSGEKIRSVQHNTPIEDIINMLTGSLARNGAGGMLANLQMNGFKISGAADATLATDLATYGQIGTSVSAALPTALANYSNPAKFTGAFTRGGIISPTQITESQNNYSPTDFDTCNVIRISMSAAWSLTGLIAPTTNANGREIRIVNISAYALTLVSESASSTAANRFTLPANLVVPAYGSIDLIYDGVSSRWRALAAAQATNANLPGNPTTTTQTTGNRSGAIATTQFVGDEIAALTIGVTPTFIAGVASGDYITITGIPTTANFLDIVIDGLSISSGSVGASTYQYLVGSTWTTVSNVNGPDAPRDLYSGSYANMGGRGAIRLVRVASAVWELFGLSEGQNAESTAGEMKGQVARIAPSGSIIGFRVVCASRDGGSMNASVL